MTDGERLDLARLRQKIHDIDEQFIQLSAERVALARDVGKFKLQHNLPVKDFKVEKDIIERARVRARTVGVYEELIEETLKLQIKYSVFAQEEFHSRARQVSENGKRILIIGGLGKMGLWLAQFFESFGHRIQIIDIQTPDEKTRHSYEILDSLASAYADQDFIVLATPISCTPAVLEELVELRPKGIIFDICALKTPILPFIKKATAAGLRISSILPMFAPNIDILAGQNIVFCEHGNPRLTEDVRALFEGTTANLINIALDQHDTFMSVVLGLSHFLNLSFAKTLTDSGLAASDLEKVASSTFRSQLDVAIPVVNENQDLYYEIQAENAHTRDMVASLTASMQAYLSVILRQDRSQFKTYMDEAKTYLGAKP